MTLEQSLAQLIEICLIHERRMIHGLKRINHLMPMTSEKLEQMSDDDYLCLDGVVGRFEKLQDTLGQKIFSRILKLEEEFEISESFLDRLHKLEKLKVLDSTDAWIELRKLRNELSHEYACMESEELSTSINTFVAACQDLLKIWHDVERYVASIKPSLPASTGQKDSPNSF